jgi:hypothetical protein
VMKFGCCGCFTNCQIAGDVALPAVLLDPRLVHA